MSKQIKINSDINKVNLEDVNPKIVVKDNNRDTSVNVGVSNTKIISVATVGPRGATGPAGSSGPSGSVGPSGSGGFPYSGSDAQFGTPPQAIITGSLLLSGSGHITASGNISSSGYIITNNYVDVKTSATGYKLSGAKVVYIDNTKYHFGRQSVGTVISGSTIELGKETTTHTTASGNISASGNIIGAQFTSSKGILINAELSWKSIQNPFLIKFNDGNGQPEKFSVSSSGVVRWGALDTLPTPITGGLVYSASNFYMGL